MGGNYKEIYKSFKYPLILINRLIIEIHSIMGFNLVKAIGDKYAIYGLGIMADSIAGVVKTYTWEDLDAKQVFDYLSG